MSNKQRRHPLAAAGAVAHELRGLLAPFCDRIEVGGSIRRRRSTVGDIELLAIPPMDGQRDMFGGVAGENDQLDQAVRQLMADGVLAKRRRADGALSGYGPANKLLLHVPSGISVDLFSTTAANWGMSMAIRTGPADFVVRMMTRFRSLGMRGHASRGVTGTDGAEIDCPNEGRVFDLLDWPWVPPERRR